MDIKYDGFYRDFLNNKAALSTTDSVFCNNECLFCEFNDIITPTWLNIIKYIILNKPSELMNYLDISKVSTYDTNKLLGWYIFRKHRNALVDIKKDNVPDIEVHEIANELFKKEMAYYDSNNEPILLNYAYTLLKTLRAASNIIGKFVIYVEQANPVVDKFLTSIYGNKVDIRSGDLVGALSNISNDSTFIFSDVLKINALIKADKLKGSSVILADCLLYNYKEDGKINNDNLIVDISSLVNEYDFKFSTFDNISDIISK